MVFLVLNKKGARKRIEFVYHSDDDWFIDVKHIMNNSNKLNYKSMITQGRLDTWIESYLNDNWFIKEDYRNEL